LEVKETLELFDIYVLNLVVTIAMFLVLIFRAWVEFKQFRTMWKEMEWRRTCETAREVLKSEKNLFTGVEGGQELYDVLRHLFKVDEDKD
jgi:hypothetical protein